MIFLIHRQKVIAELQLKLSSGFPFFS